MNSSIKVEKEELRTILERAKGAGYRAFECTRETSAYAWVITPSHNLLYIENTIYAGFKVSFKYKPDRQCGSSCACVIPDKEILGDIDLVTLTSLEAQGYAYAYRLGAVLYTDEQVDHHFESYWDKENVREL